MVSRRRQLGKFTPARFADPPWDREHSDWIRWEQELPAEHLARRIVAAIEELDLTPLWNSYGAGGTAAVRPDLMLAVVLIELQRGRCHPSQWVRDVQEHTPLMWAGFGIRPSRTCWYEFADRIAPFLDEWNRQVVAAARRVGLTTATRGAQDGSTFAANASRHRLLNEERLAKRLELLHTACAADHTGEAPPEKPGWMAATPAGREDQHARHREAQLKLAERHAANDRQTPARRLPRKKIVVSPSAPEAAVGRDKLKVFRPLYNGQFVLDLDSPLILGYDLAAQTGDEGTLKRMLKKLPQTFGVRLELLLADAAYVTACNLACCRRAGVTLYGPWQENDSTSQKKAHAKRPALFPKDQFTWCPDNNAYRCPQGNWLTRSGQERRPQSDGEIQVVHRYRCAPQHCRTCPRAAQCTTSPNRGRSLRRSEHEELIEAHKIQMRTDEAKTLYKLRRQTVELAFADLKEHRHLRRFSGRGLSRARRQLALTVLAHNLTVISSA